MAFFNCKEEVCDRLVALNVAGYEEPQIKQIGLYDAGSLITCLMSNLATWEKVLHNKIVSLSYRA